MDDELKILTDEMWHRNDLTYKFHEGQLVIEQAFKNVTAKLFVANCSRRFGKTYWIVIECLRVARTVNRARVKIATAYLTDLEEFIIPAFDAVLEDCPEELKPRWNATKKKYIFVDQRSEIQLIGLDRKPNGGRGNYCDLYVFDEAAYIKNVSYIYSSVVVPMTMYRKGARVIMISTPPKSPDHDFKDFCTKAKLEGGYVELDIHKNPMVTPEIIKEYKAECLTETDWEREYLCQFVTDETLAIIPEMKGYKYLRGATDENYQYYHKYNAMDLGVRDLNVNLFGYYDFLRAKIVIERELVMSGPKMTTPYLHAEISKIETELWGTVNPLDPDGPKVPIEPYKRVADNNNPMLLQDLGSIHNMFFHSTSKDTLHAMINHLRVWFQQGRIEIDPSCVVLIASLQFGIWNETRSEFARSKTLGHFDALATLMYMVRNIDEHTNPIPVKVGFDQINLDEEHRLEGLKALMGRRK